MKKGQIIKGPAIIRRLYRGDWEYALLLPNGEFMPFGGHPPTSIKWVYQVTWKDKLQRVHTMHPDEFKGYDESICWWITRRNAAVDVKPYLDLLLPLHAGPAPKL